MNSQLLPVSDLSLIQLRIEERVDDAARRRALRGLEHTGPFASMRRMTADLLVGFGQRVRPTAPTTDPGDEHVLIPLAR
jgi:hypothetical protein